MDASLTNDDPEYPGLMVDLNGQPVGYTNGGYIEEVTPLLGDPGLFEMNHFYTGAGASLTQVWRIPVATNFALNDATVTFELPAELDGADVSVTFNPTSTNEQIPGWGAQYGLYTWSERATAADNGDGSWTVTLGDLPAASGTVFQFNVALGDTDFTVNDRFVASADLTGTYQPDISGGNCEIPDRPALPEPTPDLEECTAEFLGQTLWTVYDKDITERTKIQGEITSDEYGEVNADGWGAGADAWGEGDTRTFRLYAATTVPLTDVTYVIDAVQGMTFNPASITGNVSTPAAGALQGNGYVEPVEGATVTSNEAGTQLIVHVERMPAMSSLSFNATGVLDGSLATMALNHRLVGAVEDWAQPEPEVTTSEWVKTSEDCEAGTVTDNREITTIEYEWDRSSLTWVPAEPVVTTETRERAMTDAELAACEQVTPPGEEDPSMEDDSKLVSHPSGEGSGELSNTGNDSLAAIVALSVMLVVTGAAALLMRRRLS